MQRNKLKQAALVIAMIIWAVVSMKLWPPRKWEDLTPEELLRHDIDATAIF